MSEGSAWAPGAQPSQDLTPSLFVKTSEAPRVAVQLCLWKADVMVVQS